ncbi:transcriptional regulator, HxlR family [Reichenbachiella faecimaris]|uniref:Transcriptional regulator, HxlR family n=1 Tax=Reichenbachiella faecimaris TaxID=692418 RepID=A0A1W2GEI0_REIFA|nr:helix-turn-helix domain-containing protein [Reichenbachiella faecimaris]SMD34656.1 transcriptional regulator, HxlR family [Reichenbachiella faecimaris]
MSTYSRKTKLKADCPMERALNVMTGKWKLALLCELNRRNARLVDFEKKNPEASKRTLAQQLGELVKDGIVQKKDFQVYPKKVEYSLTSLGKELIPVIQKMGEFGEKL